MFWGITLENGKVYSQIIEQSFHISMAALGFENLTSEPTTIMVECEKADYALCTLQAGKIPQQALDLNFTEGEEVKFFLEGNGGVVHLTGYLLETPREYEYDEDGLDELLSSEEEEEEEDASSDESDQDEAEAKNSADDSSDEMEIVGSCDFEVQEKSERKKAAQNDASDDDEDDDDDDVDDNDDDDDVGISWQDALQGALKDEDLSSDSGDNDWNPKKASKRTRIKVNTKKPKQKIKEPISKTLVDLMDIADDSEESSDEDWAPQLDTKTNTSLDNADINDSETQDKNSFNGVSS